MPQGTPPEVGPDAHTMEDVRSVARLGPHPRGGSRPKALGRGRETTADVSPLEAGKR